MTTKRTFACWLFVIGFAVMPIRGVEAREWGGHPVCLQQVEGGSEVVGTEAASSRRPALWVWLFFWYSIGLALLLIFWLRQQC